MNSAVEAKGRGRPHLEQISNSSKGQSERPFQMHLKELMRSHGHEMARASASIDTLDLIIDFGMRYLQKVNTNPAKGQSIQLRRALTIEDAAEALNVSVSTINNWKSRGVLREGRHFRSEKGMVRYHPDIVDRFFEDGEDIQPISTKRKNLPVERPPKKRTRGGSPIDPNY